MRRRALLTTGGALALGVLAGCASDQPADETTPDGTTGTTTNSPTDAPTTTTADDDGDAAEFGSLYRMEDNYAAEVTYSDAMSDVSGTATVRYHGEDYYQRIEPDDTEDVIELYHVDGTDYVVMNGEMCIKNPGPSMEPEESSVDTEADTYVEKPDAGLTAKGTSTIDGDEVYVFEVGGEDVEDTLTLYVLVSTGHLRRVESDWGRIDFHSWGDVEPITPPDMECQEFGS